MWAAPYVDGDLPPPDNYELFCQDLKEVVQDLNSFTEYRAVAPCFLPRASHQWPPELPVVKQYLARYSEALALNMGAVPVAVATPAVCSSNSTSRNTLPEQQWAKENSPGSVESSILSTFTCSTDPGPVGPTSSQAGEVTPTSVPVLSGSANLPAQKPDPVPPGGPEPQKTEEEVSETEVDQETSLGTPQCVVNTSEAPGDLTVSPLPTPQPWILHTAQADATVLLVMEWAT